MSGTAPPPSGTEPAGARTPAGFTEIVAIPGLGCFPQAHLHGIQPMLVSSPPRHSSCLSSRHALDTYGSLGGSKAHLLLAPFA